MGADTAVDARLGDAASRVFGLTGGQGEDVAIESVGVPKTVHQSLEMTNPGGRVMIFGISHQPLPSLDLYRMYLKGITLVFPRVKTQADFQKAVDLVASKGVYL